MVLLDFVYGIILAYKYDSIAIRLYYDIESSYCIALYSLLSIPLIVLECYYGIPIHLMFVDLLFIFILFYLDGNSVVVMFLRIALTFFLFHVLFLCYSLSGDYPDYCFHSLGVSDMRYNNHFHSVLCNFCIYTVDCVLLWQRVPRVHPMFVH